MTESPPPDCPRDPILRVVPRPADINANGHIFGGWVLSQMDIAGGIVAGREAQGQVATVAIATMEFMPPTLLLVLIPVSAHPQPLRPPSLGLLIARVPTSPRGGK